MLFVEQRVLQGILLFVRDFVFHFSSSHPVLAWKMRSHCGKHQLLLRFLKSRAVARFHRSVSFSCSVCRKTVNAVSEVSASTVMTT